MNYRIIDPTSPVNLAPSILKSNQIQHTAFINHHLQLPPNNYIYWTRSTTIITHLLSFIIQQPYNPAIYVIHPFQLTNSYRPPSAQKRTKKETLVVIFVVWCIAIFLCAPLFYGYGIDKKVHTDITSIFVEYYDFTTVEQIAKDYILTALITFT